MLEYRVFSFDGASRIVSADVIAASSDGAALAQASKVLKGFAGEVWLRERFVGRVSARQISQSS